MNRRDLIAKLMLSRPGWRSDETASAHVSLETLLETLEHLNLLDVPDLQDLRVCGSCNERHPWPDGFANGAGKGLSYVCKRCASDAWLQMLPSNKAFSLSCPRTWTCSTSRCTSPGSSATTGARDCPWRSMP